MRMHPCFDIPLPNRPIVLGTELARIRLGRKTLNGTLTGRVTMVPRPKVTLDVEVPPYFALNLAEEAQVTMLSSGTEIPCQIVKGQMISQTPSTIGLRPFQDVAQGALDTPVAKVVFALPNFPDFLAHSVVRELPNGGGIREDEMRLSFEGWKVTIRNTTDIKERKELLDEDGGSGITAIGILESTDGRPFTWQNAEPHIEALRVFLSFVCGRWTGPMLPAGLDPAGERVWFRWSVPLVGQGCTVFTWFDTHHGMTLSDIAPAFMAKWHDPVWKETLSYAIYWFVRANSAAAGSDGSLILSQAALEILSWTYLVTCSGMSRRAFKEMPAAKTIGQLLTAIGIPSEVPVSLKALQSISSDGAAAIVIVRNDLVHPEKRAGVLPATEAWTLAQRFIELVILKLCEFDGEHANRTISPRWVGQVEPVPREL
ncbi:MAG TPA: hypothetical protein VH351_01820 [Bryobacteraceae bacterium]|jgi:hypothetical protein|nr:hypothetical protein [Bryobacteraceae bacterium]